MKDTAPEADGTALASPPAKSVSLLTVNGTVKQLEVAPWTSLLDLLRERLDLTGTKKGIVNLMAHVLE